MTARHPPLTPVKSSAMKAMHYDPETKALHVQFPSGDVYVYDDVSHERAFALEGSSSIGHYFGTEIKPHHLGRKVL